MLLDKIKSKISRHEVYNISFVGDSITSAEWVNPNWREIVEYVVKDSLTIDLNNWQSPAWDIRCFNCGFDGATTQDLLNMFDERIASTKPDLIIYLADSNDYHPEISPEGHKELNIELLDKMKKAATDVIALTSSRSTNESYNNMYAAYAAQFASIFPKGDIQFINLFQIFEKFPRERFFTFVSAGNEDAGIKAGDIDFLHPNQLGNAYIAKVILEEGLGIKFDSERYIKDVQNGVMTPTY